MDGPPQLRTRIIIRPLIVHLGIVPHLLRQAAHHRSSHLLQLQGGSLVGQHLEVLQKHSSSWDLGARLGKLRLRSQGCKLIGLSKNMQCANSRVMGITLQSQEMLGLDCKLAGDDWTKPTLLSGA